MNHHIEELDSSKPYLFFDVDGVINASDAEPKQMLSEVTILRRGVDTSFILRANSEVIKLLSELSRETNFLWLTTWNHDACEQLSDLWGIKSAGHISWNLKLSDYTQYGKLVGLNDFLTTYDVKKFVWVDDIATMHKEEISGNASRLVIQTNSDTGITLKEIKLIRSFIDDEQ